MLIHFFVMLKSGSKDTGAALIGCVGIFMRKQD
nr:MAG TPA: hypothetical protein [Caudoviricetes sp.]